jgi:methionyl-tRNA formyltransferase
VLTQPDRPFGRGLAVGESAVKRYAVAHALPMRQPESLKPAPVQSELAQTPLDVLVVAAYGLILPRAVLDWPRQGWLNIHASLLRRWRGAAPIERAIEAGDRESGITIMRMDAGLDTGPIVSQEAIPLDARETAGVLRDRLAALGARLIADALLMLARDGRVAERPQPRDGVTYAAKLARPDTLIDWARPAAELDRLVRALAPSPGAVAGWQGSPVKVRAAIPMARPTGSPPGTVVAVGAEGIDVACGSGVLRLERLQPAAGRPMSAAAFAAGRELVPGRSFEPGT